MSFFFFNCFHLIGSIPYHILHLYVKEIMLRLKTPSLESCKHIYIFFKQSHRHYDICSVVFYSFTTPFWGAKFILTLIPFLRYNWANTSWDQGFKIRCGQARTGWFFYCRGECSKKKAWGWNRGHWRAREEAGGMLSCTWELVYQGLCGKNSWRGVCVCVFLF